jgi:uncharacterized protein
MTATLRYPARARVPTRNGSRYLQQLCKHWSHNLAVTVTPERGEVTFPRDVRGADHPGDATVTFKAEPACLEVCIEASAPAQRDQLKEVVARHLDRFAFREAPLTFEWRDL